MDPIASPENSGETRPHAGIYLTCRLASQHQMPVPDSIQTFSEPQYCVDAECELFYLGGIGSQALQLNTTGYDNTASGAGALQANTTGFQNAAGREQCEPHWHERDSNGGVFVAGIYDHPLAGNVVVVKSNGRLGVQAVSSERFKTAIAPMGSNTAKLGSCDPSRFT